MPLTKNMPLLRDRARAMRKAPTDAEALLWRVLRNRQVMGAKFRRQAPISAFIVDFVCEEHRLIVEADGGQHAGRLGDVFRTRRLEAMGYKVLRFWNHQVFKELDGVLATIAGALAGANPLLESAPAAAPPVRRATRIVSAAGDEADAVVLTYENRYRRRGLLATQSGAEILLDLPEATELPDGAALLLEGGRRILIRAADEPLAALTSPGRPIARLAWHIGNRHTPCQIDGERLLIQRDHVLEDMLRGLGAEIAHIAAPFTPEGGAYGHGRTHGHSHSHDPQADPNAHIPHRHG